MKKLFFIFSVLVYAFTLQAQSIKTASINGLKTSSSNTKLKIIPKMEVKPNFVYAEQKIAPLSVNLIPQYLTVSDFPPYSTSYNPPLTSVVATFQISGSVPSTGQTQLMLCDNEGSGTLAFYNSPTSNNIFLPNSTSAIVIPVFANASLHNFLLDPNHYYYGDQAGVLWVTVPVSITITELNLALTFADGVTKTVIWNTSQSGTIMSFRFNQNWQINPVVL